MNHQKKDNMELIVLRYSSQEDSTSGLLFEKTPIWNGFSYAIL